MMKKTILILFSVLFLNQHVFAVTLFEALTETYKNNTDLNAERENINISKEDLKISKSELLTFCYDYRKLKVKKIQIKLTNRSGVENAAITDVNPKPLNQLLVEQTINSRIFR